MNPIKFFHRAANLMLLSLLFGSLTQLISTMSGPAIRDLNLDMPYFEQQANTWTPYGLVSPTPSSLVTTECGTGPLLGGPGIFSSFPSISKMYPDLVPHVSVFLTFDIILIDEVSSNVDLYCSFPSRTFSFDSQSFLSNLCGASDNDLAIKVWLYQTTSDSNFGIQISQQNNAQFGVRNVNIALSNYSLNGYGGCVYFPSGYGPSQFQCPCLLGQYEHIAPETYQCLPCHSSCETCYGGLETQCLTCIEGYSYNGDTCIECDSTCNTCFGTGADQCASCPGGSTHCSDYTCQTTCEASDTSDTPLCTETNTVSYEQVQNGTLYYYTNTSVCKTSCPSPYTVVQADGNIALCELLLSEQDIKTVANIESAGATAGSIMTAGVTVLTALSPSNPSAVSVATLAKMFEYTRQFNVTRSPRLELYFQSHRTSPGTVEIGPGLSTKQVSKFPSHSLPEIFVQNDLYSAFLVNFFESLGTLLIISAATLFLFGIAPIFKRKYTKFDALYQKLVLAVVSFLITQFYGVYPDILFYGTLEFISFGGGNALAWLSFLIAIVFYLLAAIILAFHFKLIWTYQQIKTKAGTEEGDKLKEFNVKHQKSEVLYKEFRDSTFIEQSILLFLTARAGVTGIVMAALYNYPGIQIVFNILMNILTIIYLSFKLPYKSLPIVYQQIADELDFILINICFLVMALLDASEEKNDNLRALFGDIIIHAILVSKFIPIITIVPQLLDALGKALKVLKDRKKSKNNYETPSSVESPIASNARKEEIEIEVPGEDHLIVKAAVEFDQEEGKKTNMISMTHLSRQDNEFEHEGMSPRLPILIRPTLLEKYGETPQTSSRPLTSEMGTKPINLDSFKGDSIPRTEDESNLLKNEGTTYSPIIKPEVRETLTK